MTAIDLEKLNHLVDEKYLRMQKHPSADLLIWNYTEKCQYEKYWTEETLMCRGLITDSNGNIKARPFKKFFNLGENDIELPNEPFQVFDKLDGSLGITYWVDGRPYIATRGSFTSDQAVRANQILHTKYASYLHFLIPDNTYLWEIIYPENRIVVDYHGMEDLVLLAIIDTDGGHEFPHMPTDMEWPFKVVKMYDGITDIETLTELATDNAEGFVVRFITGLRLKLKFEEYVRLHRIVTGVTSKSIWEIIAVEDLANEGQLGAKWIGLNLHIHVPDVELIMDKKGGEVQELLERVPDEFYAWVKKTINELNEQFEEVNLICTTDYASIDTESCRKEQAMQIKQCRYPDILFRMMNGNSYRGMIWRVIKPEHTKPFKQDIDA